MLELLERLKLPEQYQNVLGYVGLGLALCVLGYISYLNRGFQIDDALIYQRYIQNFLDGKGLVYNEGEYFNALTSPLYTYLATFFSVLLFGNVQVATILLSTLLLAITLILLVKVFSNYQPPIVAALGSLFVVCFPYMYFVYGMETPLFLCLIAACLYFFEKQNIAYLGVACALLLVTRSEGVFLVLALAVEHFRQRRPFPALKHFILPLAIISSIFLFNKFYYGTFLAETGMAKVYQGRSGLWGAFPAFGLIDYQIGWFFYSSWTKFYLLIALAIAGVVGLGWVSINITIVLFMLFYTAFYVFLNIPNYHWYYAPYYLFGLFYVAFGLYWIYSCAIQVRSFAFKAGHIAILLLLTYYMSYMTFSTTRKHDQIGDVNHTYRDIGIWLKEHTDKNAKVALVEIGHVGLYSERYLIDILGLVNHSNARFFGERKFSEWLKHYVPDYILVHKDVWLHEQGAGFASLLGDFVNVTEFPIRTFMLIKRQSSNIKYIPTEIKSVDARLAFEGNQAVFMAHVDGKIRFELPPGEYQLKGQMGILKEAYSKTNTSPTDGVSFEVIVGDAGEAKTIFSRLLNPLANNEDRGIVAFTTEKFTLKKPTSVTLHTGAGPQNNSSSDWSFWRNISF